MEDRHPHCGDADGRTPPARSLPVRGVRSPTRAAATCVLATRRASEGNRGASHAPDFDLVFPGAKPGAAPRVTTAPSSQSLVQQRLVQALGIDRLIPDAAPQDAR